MPATIWDGMRYANKIPDMKSPLYTRTGDQGETSLVGGQRVAKDSIRLESYGTLDELSSHLGKVASLCDDEIRGQIHEIQNELFNIGSYLATLPAPGEQPACPSLEDGARLQQLELWIDALDEQTPPMKCFILPGGDPVAAEAHIARTVCRRAERNIIALSRSEYVDPAVIRYINRLSDYLFAAARYINFIKGIADIAWRK